MNYRIMIIVSLIMGVFIFLGCEEINEKENPEDLIVGYWNVVQSVTEYKDCDWGNGTVNQYHSSNPMEEGYWNWLINKDGTWSYEWLWSNGHFSESTGTWHLTDNILSLEYESGVDIWTIEFEGKNTLHLSNERDCSISGTTYSYRKWRRAS